MPDFNNKIPARTAGYHYRFLKLSPTLTQAGMMSGWMLLLQLPLAFCWGMLTMLTLTPKAGIFSVVVGIGILLFHFWFMRLNVNGLQKAKTGKAFLGVLALISMLSGFYTTGILVDFFLYTSDISVPKTLENGLTLMELSDYFSGIAADIERSLLVVLLFLGTSIFFILPFWMIYINRKNTYYYLIRTYRLLKIS